MKGLVGREWGRGITTCRSCSSLMARMAPSALATLDARK